MANKRSVATEDLRTYASAPVLRAASLKSGSLCAVRNTTFDEQPDSRSRSTAARVRFFLVILNTLSQSLNGREHEREGRNPNHNYVPRS
jgi:hypothetical protein